MQDLLFYQKRKHDNLRLVFAPQYFKESRSAGSNTSPESTTHERVHLVDTHAHLDMLESPAYHLARCAFWGVSTVVSIVDPSEQPNTTFDKREAWCLEAQERLVPLFEASGISLEQFMSSDNYTHEERLEIVKSYQAWGIDPNVRATTWQEVIASSKAYAGLNTASSHASFPLTVAVALGCHPHNARKYTQDMEDYIAMRIKRGKACALGEVGLDYHYDYSPRDVQREVFRRQIRLAHALNVPLLLHLRSAHDEAFAILKEEGFPEAGVLLHCFCLGFDKARTWLDAGCKLAMGGAVTFKRFDPLRECAVQIPQSYLMVETDAPFMTPEPMRGIDCGPEYVLYAAQTIALERSSALNTSPYEELRQIEQTSKQFFSRVFQ